MIKLWIGLVLLIAGIVTTVIVIDESHSWDMGDYDMVLWLLPGPLLIIVGLRLLWVYFESWLKKRK